MIGPARIDEVFTIKEQIVGDPPNDHGNTNVWMDAEIIDIDHRYVYIEKLIQLN